jgi:hypothetical protein
LDYLGSSCPKILLEPQRSNLCLRSEDFGNAGWGKTTATVTANTTSAPDGTISADTFDATNNFAFVSQAPTLASGTATTYSVFIKNIDAPYVNLQVRTTVTAGLARFDFTGSTLTSTTLTTGTSSSFTDYGNGWYRCVLVCTTSEANQQFRIQVPSTGNSVFLWGAMIEAGAYPTSYVKTEAATVTRLADAASKTGVSSLIGQTEGTVFFEVDYSTLSGLSMFLSIRPDGSNKVEVYRDGGTIYGELTASSSFAITATKAVGTHKIAFAYKSGSSALYIDGVLAGASTTSFSFTSSLVDFAVNARSGGSFNEAANYKQLLLFKTRLTNAQLAELTTL